MASCTHDKLLPRRFELIFVTIISVVDCKKTRPNPTLQLNGIDKQTVIEWMERGQQCQCEYQRYHEDNPVGKCDHFTLSTEIRCLVTEHSSASPLVMCKSSVNPPWHHPLSLNSHFRSLRFTCIFFVFKTEFFFHFCLEIFEDRVEPGTAEGWLWLRRPPRHTSYLFDRY